jgi:GntR family transcriptional regulator
MSLPERAAEDIRQAIRAGAYTDGRLPAEPVLAQQLGVSKATVRHAVSILEQEGLLSRRQGAGTFVVGRALGLHNNLSVNFGVTELIESAGFTAGTAVATVDLETPDPQTQRALGVEANSRVLVLRRTRTADGRVVARTTDHVAATHLLGHGMTDEQAVAFVRMHQSLYGALADLGVMVRDGIAEVIPWRAEPDIARDLGIRTGTLLLRLDQTDYDVAGDPILFSTEFFVATAFKFQVYRKGRAGDRRTPQASRAEFAAGRGLSPDP